MFSFETEDKTWQEFYTDMPEYNNKELPPPLMTATFKFRSMEDYEAFMKVVTEQLYEGVRVFDGFQSKENKTAWYPLPDQGSKYTYV